MFRIFGPRRPQPTRPCPVCSQPSSTAYWRRAYETLVKETGRDLNDGLGRDPRSRKP